MANTTIIGCQGLYTDPNAIVPPTGAMRQAVNVVIDAPGTATARPNFDLLNQQLFTGVEERVPHVMTAYAGRMMVVSRGIDGGDGEWFLDNDGGGPFSTEFTPPNTTLSATQFAQARRNLYMTHEAGIQKITNPDGTGAFPFLLNMHAPGQVMLSLVAGTWFQSSEFVAYRVVVFRIDKNDLETRSAPSGWTYIQHDGGAVRNVQVRVPIPAFAVEGDTIEVYRTTTVTTAPPSDVMFLAKSHVLSFSEISAGFVDIVDDTPPAMLGQMLYTSSGREGIEGANNSPPQSISLATWNDSVWVGGTLYRAALAIDLMRPWTAPSASITGSSSTGFPTWTTSGPPTNVRPGQTVIVGNGAFAPGTKVLSVSGNVVTMDANALSTQPAVALELGDTFVIDNIEFYGTNATHNPGSRIFRVLAPGSNPPAAALLTARNFAEAISRGSSGTLFAHVVEEITSGSFPGEIIFPRTGRIVIERTAVSTDILAFNESLASIDVFDPVVSFAEAPENRPNRVAFSKPQEPEHFRALDWIELGREDAYVLAFAPLSNGLLVFKEDGVWSVSGVWPLFNTAKVSESIVVRGAAVDVCEDIAYAWTDHGVLAMTETGSERSLTDGKIREELRTWFETVLIGAADLQRGNPWIVSWDALHLVLIGAHDVEVLGNPFRTYCYSTITGEWSRWDRELRGPAYDERTRRLVFGRGTNDAWELRESLALVQGYDYDFQLGGMTTSGSTATVLATALNTWQPRVGDWLQRTQTVPTVVSEWHRIIAAQFLTGPNRWELTIDVPWTGTGTVTDSRAREGAPATLEWQRHGLTPPSNGGFIREIQIHLDVDGFDDLGANFNMGERLRVVGGAHSDRSKTRVTLVSTPLQRECASRPVRIGTPRAHSRSTHLYPYVEVNEGYRWRCLGIALVGVEQSDRVTRGVP